MFVGALLLMSSSIQNGWAFKMVVVSTGCAITVDHAFNLKAIFCQLSLFQQCHVSIAIFIDGRASLKIPQVDPMGVESVVP